MESSRLLARGLAGKYPYDPYFKASVRHPSLQDYTHYLPMWGDWSDPQVAEVLLGHLERLAEEKTAKRKVQHLEVVLDPPGQQAGIYYVVEANCCGDDDVEE